MSASMPNKPITVIGWSFHDLQVRGSLPLAVRLQDRFEFGVMPLIDFSLALCQPPAGTRSLGQDVLHLDQPGVHILYAWLLPLRRRNNAYRVVGVRQKIPGAFRRGVDRGLARLLLGDRRLHLWLNVGLGRRVDRTLARCR